MKIEQGKWLFGFLIICPLIGLTACGLEHGRTDPFSNPPSSDAHLGPQACLQEGIRMLSTGDLTHAYDAFNRAAEAFGSQGDLPGRCDCLVRSARVCLAMGNTEKAAVLLEAAGKTASKLDDQELLARIYALRGNLHHVSGNYAAAGKDMRQALSIAENHEYRDLLISVHNDLGNLFSSRSQYSKALEHYRASATLAKDKHDALRTAVALANGAKICITAGDRYAMPRGPARTQNSISNEPDFGQPPARRATHTRATILLTEKPEARGRPVDRAKSGSLYAEAAAMLEEARANLQDAKNTQYKTTASITTGSAYMDLAERLPGRAAGCRVKAEKTFQKAVQSTQGVGNARLKSYAFGNLGRLYLKTDRLDQAAEQTAQAIFWAIQADAPESQYQWEWQSARILTIQKRLKKAIQAYQDAIFTLESMGTEISSCYGRPRAELRRAANDLYLMYTDVLLKHASGLRPAEQLEVLKAARETVEKRKVSELREYFHDDCLGATAGGATPIDRLTRDAVVIYPIILPQRLEIIASFPPSADRAADRPRGSRPAAILRHYVTAVDAQTLNQTAADFRAALEDKDSQRYLEPARRLYQWLVRPVAPDLARSRPETLVFVPDGALRNIPMGALYDGSSFLIQSYAVAVTPGLLLTRPAALHPGKMKVLAVGISSAFRGFEALPGVADELRAIAATCPAKVLEDEEFSSANLEAALHDDQYNVIHIASHGKFSGAVEDSYILAADKRLTFEDLSGYVGLYRFRKQPLELLALSACETAAGNDQAALGMAGLAVKIGARSVLATLWAVDDRAAARLVTEFYRQLHRPGVSRAIALKLAQQKLLEEPAFSHPGYWSPFILINNWL